MTKRYSCSKSLQIQIVILFPASFAKNSFFRVITFYQTSTIHWVPSRVLDCISVSSQRQIIPQFDIGRFLDWYFDTHPIIFSRITSYLTMKMS